MRSPMYARSLLLGWLSAIYESYLVTGKSVPDPIWEQLNETIDFLRESQLHEPGGGMGRLQFYIDQFGVHTYKSNPEDSLETQVSFWIAPDNKLFAEQGVLSHFTLLKKLPSVYISDSIKRRAEDVDLHEEIKYDLFDRGWIRGGYDYSDKSVYFDVGDLDRSEIKKMADRLELILIKNKWVDWFIMVDFIPGFASVEIMGDWLERYGYLYKVLIRKHEEVMRGFEEKKMAGEFRSVERSLPRY